MKSPIKVKWYFAILPVFIVAALPVFSQACCPAPIQERGVEAELTDNDLTKKISNDPPVPDFTVPTLDGGNFTLSSQRGKPVILFIMAYWCPSCISEAKALAKLHENYKDKIRIVALDIDRSTTEENLKRFKEMIGNPDYIWAFDREGNVVKKYGIRALDTTIIFNKNGEIVYRDSRPTSYKSLEKQIKDLLKGKR